MSPKFCGSLPKYSRSVFVKPMCTQATTTKPKLNRSFLYVPSSSGRMLEKSVTAASDVIIYDLEDSISPLAADKINARRRLKQFLTTHEGTLKPLHVAVRVNDLSTPFFQDDILEIVSQPIVRSLVLPKIHSAQDLHFVSTAINLARQNPDGNADLDIIPSIESAKAMWNLGAIAGWESKHGRSKGGKLSALLFAAEDYCADTSIIRTSSGRELLFTRSQIVIAARAFGLNSIDMVCINYREPGTLKEESVDGRQLGFTGKQAIHPSQVGVINQTFAPSPEEIRRAVKIITAMKVAHGSEKGAIGIDGQMIDAPMIKQAQNTITMAELAGLEVVWPSAPNAK